MDERRWATIGVWAFAAGNFAWVFANAKVNLWVNVWTDVIIVAAAALAAIGLPRAVDGMGPGLLRTGLFAVAVMEFGQNAVTAATKLDGGNATPVLVVMVGSVAVAVGAFRWVEDGWDDLALPWLAAGFASYAFEPAYYFFQNVAKGRTVGWYLPGIVLVAFGAGLAAWVLWKARALEPQGA